MASPALPSYLEQLTAIFPELAQYKWLGIIPLIYIFYTKASQFRENADKDNLRYQANLKDSLTNPMLTNEEKSSLGNALAKENIRRAYNLNLSKVYRDKIILLESKSNFEIEFLDFSKAGTYIKYIDNEICINQKYYWYYFKAMWTLFTGFIFMAGSLLFFIFYLCGSFIDFYGIFVHEFKPTDIIIMSYIPIYLTLGFFMRDNSRSLVALIKIIEYGKKNPYEIKFLTLENGISKRFFEKTNYSVGEKGRKVVLKFFFRS